MMNESGQGFLDAIRSDWLERGWDLGSLQNFRMELAEGTASNTDGGNLDGDSQGSGNNDPGYSEFASGFLKDVPDSQKVLIEPYIKKWDQGVTKKFQEIHDEYRPYKDLGDVETLSQALNLYNALDDDASAKQIYEILKEQYGKDTADAIVQDQQNNEGQEASGLPPEIQQRLESQETMLQTLAQILLQQHEAEQTSAEDAELDNYLAQLKEKHGEFDENFVLSQMAAGMDGEDAVKAFNTLLQQYTNKQPATRTIPPTLSGGGSVPSEAQSVKDLSRQDTKSLVANILAQTASEN